MAHQLSFAEAEFTKGMHKSRKGAFLDKMEQIVPWDDFCAIISDYYAKEPVAAGRRPYPLEVMLRIHFMQHWFNLSDPGMESELYDSMAMRKFAKLGGLTNRTPDETTILNFRHMLEEHQLSARLFACVNDKLVKSGIKVSNGTIVDATIIQAPSSTKNRDHLRDPEMHSTKKGNQYYFGEKVHIGVDSDSGAIHSVAVTPANTADITMADDMIRETDIYVGGDSGYRGIEKRTRHEKVSFFISMRPGKRKKFKDTVVDFAEKLKSGVRAKVEYPFRILKVQFMYRKVRYKGIRKNEEAMFMKCCLINLYQFRNLLLSGA